MVAFDRYSVTVRRKEWKQKTGSELGVFAKLNLTIRILGTEDWFIGRMRESMEFQTGEECKKK